MFSVCFFKVVKRDRKDYIISLSKEYSLVTKFTSFVAVEHREKVKQPIVFSESSACVRACVRACVSECVCVCVCLCV